MSKNHGWSDSMSDRQLDQDLRDKEEKENFLVCEWCGHDFLETEGYDDNFCCEDCYKDAWEEAETPIREE